MNKLIIFEKRLKLLKESFDAGVIDAEEYRRNKEKIEKEIEKLQQPETVEDKPEVQETLPQQPLEPQEQEITQEDVQQPEQEISLASEDNISSEMGEEKPEFQEQTPEEEVSNIIGEETQELADEQSEQQETPIKETENETKNDVDILIEEAEAGPKEKVVDEVAAIQKAQPMKPSGEDHTLRTVLWFVCAIIVLGLLIFFSINLGQMYPNETTHEKEEQKPTIACYQHADCAKQGLESKCVNGGKAEATCQYQNATVVKLTIIGEGECASCSSERMKNVLRSWFPGAKVTEIASASSEGKSLRSQHSIEMLPAYVLGTAVESTLLFNDVKSALRKSDDTYLVKDSASGAPLFLNRNEIARQVDVFATPDDESSKLAILNLEEFSSSFGNQVTIEYHVVKDSNNSKTAACVTDLAPQRATEYLLCEAQSDNDCVATLGLGAVAIQSCVEEESIGLIEENTQLQNSLGLQVPSFLINNRMRVGGVQAADSLREQFCSMNDAVACSKELKKSLV